MTKLIIFVLWLVGLFVMYKPIANCFTIPILRQLSAATERELQNLVRRHILLEITELVLIFIFVLTTIPLQTFVIPLVIQSSSSSREFVDFVLKRKKMSREQREMFHSRHRALHFALTFGNYLITMIPVIGWFCAPMISTMAACIATIEILEKEK